MQERTLFLPVMLLSILLLLASGLSASEDMRTDDGTLYLPLITDFSDFIFQDDFSDPSSGWPVDDEVTVKWSYQEGEYEMLVREPRIWAGALAPVDGLTNYNVRASMRLLQGDTSDVGLIFNWKNWDNFYYLVVDPGDQWFGVAKVIGGNAIIVIPRTDSTLIQPGKFNNRLRIDRNGPEIAVSINGNRLATTQDLTLTGPFRAGLYMEADDVAPAIIRYDDFAIWQLDNGQAQNTAARPGKLHFAGRDNFDAALDWDNGD